MLKFIIFTSIFDLFSEFYKLLDDMDEVFPVVCDFHAPETLQIEN